MLGLVVVVSYNVQQSQRYLVDSAFPWLFALLLAPGLIPSPADHQSLPRPTAEGTMVTQRAASHVPLSSLYGVLFQ